MKDERKIYLGWEEVQSCCHKIIREIHVGAWRPDYVVGIVRGGAIPATFLSHYFDVPMKTVKVSLRDYKGIELDPKILDETGNNILIVDDINDSGATLKTLKQDWKLYCVEQKMLNNDSWDHFWDKKVRVATLVSNVWSVFQVHYYGMPIDRMGDKRWVVFPWEEWW